MKVGRFSFERLALSLIVIFVCSNPLFAQWSSDPSTNTPICVLGGSQYVSLGTVVSDGTGGAIITWFDERSGTSRIYAQRIDAFGYVQWTENGIGVCLGGGGGDQVVNQLASDGAGGAIVAWQECRGSSWPDIYAQRINASGIPQWNSLGVCVCNADFHQSHPAILPDGSGGAFISWHDNRRFEPYNGDEVDIYVQRLDASGAAQWIPGGIPICSFEGYQTRARMAAGWAGHCAIVVWQDRRSDSQGDIYVGQIDQAGNVLSGIGMWNADGIPVCTAPGQQSSNYWMLDLISDGAGGVFITWSDWRSGTANVYVQRIDSLGYACWEPNGTPVSTDPAQRYCPMLAPDGVGGAIVAWQDQRDGYASIYAQRFDAYGNPQWGTGGKAIRQGTAQQGHSQPNLISDNTGGVIISWYSGQSGGYSDLYAQRINASGNNLWSSDGVPISTMEYNQYNSEIISDGLGGAILAFTYNVYLSSTNDIYAQNVNSDGTLGISAVVTNTNDDGVGSLRRAITISNGIPGTDEITFDIPTGDPGYDELTGTWSIKPNSALPTITDPVIIDGYTQPGAIPNTNPINLGSNAVLKIELDGSNVTANGLNITGGNSTVRGLVINRFQYGILLETNGGNVIEGNFIGTDVTGTTAFPNAWEGVRLGLSSNNTIGGTTPESRNIISGNGGGGVHTLDGSANVIQGNLIGTDISGIGGLGNEWGIGIGWQNDNIIGGTEPGAGNIIAFNNLFGIWVAGGDGSGVGNAILSNSIFANGSIGIDLSIETANGVDPNDPGDGDYGGNNIQNFPVLTEAVGNGGSTTIRGTLNSTSNTDFLLQFFANTESDESGHGEGETYLGYTTVTTNVSGNVDFSVTIPVEVPAGRFISATATDSDNNTSEFSQCLEMGTVIATVDIDAVFFYKLGHGPWVTGYIELPTGYDPAEINVGTVVFEGNLPGQVIASGPTAIGDYDEDGIPDRMVKFDADAVDGLLAVGTFVDINISGQLNDGTHFVGTRTIKVDPVISAGDTILSDVILMQDILDCPGNGLWVMADDITVDGNGYKLTGTGVGTGVILQRGNNVMFEHFFVIGFNIGIEVQAADGCNIYLNNISSNAVGLVLTSFCSGVDINNNKITGNILGLDVQVSGNRIFSNFLFDNKSQIQDMGGNVWSVGGYGNYWSNYWGLDDGSNGRVAGDFIGDTDLPHEGVDDFPVLDPSIIGPFLGGDWWISCASLVWRGGWSPVEIQVIDPLGRVISYDENQMPFDGYYAETDEYLPGTKLVQIVVYPYTPEPYSGIYSFQMTALDSLTYWMESFVSSDGQRLLYQRVDDMPLAAGETRFIDTQFEVIIDSITGDTIINATPANGQISGTITDQYKGNPIPDVIIDLYNAAGDSLLACFTTSSTGFYIFTSYVVDSDTHYLQPGEEYLVVMILPQGYITNDLTMKAALVPSEVNFTAYVVDGVYARGMGYWKHQVNKAIQGNPHDYTGAELLAFLVTIHTEWAYYDDVLTLEDMKAVFDAHQGMAEQAARHLLALELNVAAGNLSVNAQVDLGELSAAATVGEAILDAEAILFDSNSTHEDYERAKDIAETLNSMQGFKGGPQSLPLSLIPQVTTIQNNTPNPFYRSTKIAYALALCLHVRLTVYNVAGQLVETVVDAVQEPGYYNLVWNSRSLPGGVYFLRFEAGNVAEVKKMVLVI